MHAFVYSSRWIWYFSCICLLISWAAIRASKTPSTNHGFLRKTNKGLRHDDDCQHLLYNIYSFISLHQRGCKLGGDFYSRSKPIKVVTLLFCFHHFPLPHHQASHDPFTKQDQPLHHTIGNDSLCFCACPWLLPHHHLLPFCCEHLHYFCTFSCPYNISPWLLLCL